MCIFFVYNEISFQLSYYKSSNSTCKWGNNWINNFTFILVTKVISGRNVIMKVISGDQLNRKLYLERRYNESYIWRDVITKIISGKTLYRKLYHLERRYNESYIIWRDVITKVISSGETF